MQNNDKSKCKGPNTTKNLKNHDPVPEIISVDSSDNFPNDDISDNVLADNNITNDISDDIPDDVSNDVSGDIPDNISDNISDDIFENDSHCNSLTDKPKFVLRYSSNLKKQESVPHSYETSQKSASVNSSHSNSNSFYSNNSINHV